MRSDPCNTKKDSCPDTGILTVRTAIVPGAFSFVRRMFGSKVSLVMGDLFCSYFMWPLCICYSDRVKQAERSKGVINARVFE